MVAVKFNAEELMEMAIQTERNGKDYYAAMANKSDNQAVKDIFNYLGREEQSHLDLFVTIRNKFAASKTDSFNIADEYNTPDMMNYLKAMFDGKVFPNLLSHAELAAEIQTDEQAVYHAIGFEKDTILFFSEILGLLGQQDENYALIQELIRQEKIHIARLYTLLGNLK